MKIVGGLLGFLLFVGLAFIVYTLVKSHGGASTSATGGNWLSKPAQSSTWDGVTPGASQTRSGAGHF